MTNQDPIRDADTNLDNVGLSATSGRDAVKFFATEIVDRMVRRVNERYPVTKGYSPVHIALVAVYRAMRTAHHSVNGRGTNLPIKCK